MRVGGSEMRDLKSHRQMYAIRIWYQCGETEEYGWTTSMNKALGELYSVKGDMEHPQCPYAKVEMIRGVFLEEE